MTNAKEGTITVSVEERKLSDGSPVYDVIICQDNGPDDRDDVIICHCRNQKHAEMLAGAIIGCIEAHALDTVVLGDTAE